MKTKDHHVFYSNVSFFILGKSNLDIPSTSNDEDILIKKAIDESLKTKICEDLMRTKEEELLSNFGISNKSPRKKVGFMIYLIIHFKNFKPIE